MWAIVRDIADRKRAERALKQAHDELERRVEQRTADLVKANEQLIVFRQFVEASMQGFAMAKLNGEITYVNPTIGRLLADGRSEDIIGKHVSTIYSEDYMQKREKEILPALLREGHWEGEVAIAHPGGSVLTLQDSFLVRDEQGSPVYVATVLTDITERKRAEEVVRQSEEKYRRLLEACPDAVVMTDFNGRILFASQQVCSLGGLSDPQ
jgi:two-component system, sensor histidine kinase and response regulator